MSHRNANLFSANEANFGAAGSSTLAGWELVSSATGHVIRLDDIFFYPKYTPENFADYTRGRTLGVISSGTNDITVKSPWVPVGSNERYMASILAFSGNNDFDVTLDVEFNTTNSGTGDTYATDNSLSQPVTVTLSTFGDASRMFRPFTSRATDQFARLVVKISGGSSGNLANRDVLYLYDPVMGEDSFDKIGPMSSSSYSTLPAFMRLDDEKINDIVSDAQSELPLRRFLESLLSFSDEIFNEAKAFEYTRPTEGTESKSKLTDPDTAKSEYLAWLAGVTATQLLVSGSGFTPWTALESYDGGDAGTTPGEWTDMETFADWLALQAHDPDFFDTVQSFQRSDQNWFYWYSWWTSRHNRSVC